MIVLKGFNLDWGFFCAKCPMYTSGDLKGSQFKQTKPDGVTIIIHILQLTKLAQRCRNLHQAIQVAYSSVFCIPWIRGQAALCMYGCVTRDNKRIEADRSTIETPCM